MKKEKEEPMTQAQQPHTPDKWRWEKAKTLRHLHIGMHGAVGAVNMSALPRYDNLAELIANAPTLRADNARLRGIVEQLAERDCEYTGSAGCDLLPRGVRRSVCLPCQSRAMLNIGEKK